MALCLLLSLLLAACRPATEGAGTPVAPDSTHSTSTAVSATALQQDAEALLALHRQIIVLMDGEAALPAEQRRAVAAVGQMMFHELQQRNQALVARTTASHEPALVAAVGELLDRIESEPDWFDADRLAFREFLAQLQPHHAASQSLAGLKLAKRAQEDLLVLAEVEQAYEQELKDSFGRFAKRGIELKREKWRDYLAKLGRLYSREQIMKAHQGGPSAEALALPPAGAPPEAAAEPADPAASGLRGKASKPGKDTKEDGRELFGLGLPAKTVLLTFDDGPHGRYTDEILAILKRYEARAVFFQLGQNLGRVDAKGQVLPGAGSQVARRVLAAGHVLANHSYSHGLMSKFEPGKVRSEAADTEALLDGAGRSGAPLFRFPYGARNEAALSTIEALKLRSMMWTVDSLDWSDPIPKSIAARVLGELERRQRGIVLFHDIHARTVQALPLILDQLHAEGYQFARWSEDGRILSPEARPATASADGAAEAPLSGTNLYRDSHALIIGIDQYQRWPRLAHAGRDARVMRDTLQKNFGFPAENISLLLDGEATRANILRALNGLVNARQGEGRRVRRDDRVFVFFAGHGSTRRLPSGREIGYVIPVDAGLDDLQTDAIAMPQLQEVGEALAAKHALFIIDACYSGLGLTRAGAAGGSANFIRDNARRMGRQMMTAGGADQQVADDGPGGHSVFTWTLLQALTGKADLNGDGLITGTELAAYVAPAVASIARQTPAFGSLPGSEGGEFVFELAANEQSLSSDSAQLDAAASRLAKRIDEAGVAQPQASSASGPAVASVLVKGLDGRDVALAPPSARVDPGARIAAQRANDRGLQLYKERRYEEAEAAFAEALRLQPRFALAANNLGFIFYKRSRPQEAARWYEKALEMDGSRALAWLNLGDARLLAGDESGALKAYAAFVALSPKHGRADALRAWIAQPDAAHRPQPAQP
ncbi:polysaccharide deacetylase family protein [Paucibacter sp. DJ2R-2]|uniref:polysaccharide deacetylase family protein n=1 Tax=Paucibacter sp. DJ2R-2 TaxID=2893558 RepID=UPI0021E361F2|nr:polysaccharide deacetylase family protein [Paucibacter sp. DJ2R-2]MCV2419635.1 caspase family protein [Paucibacter sp. DJ4R-1]MCV2437461.1 caspase family protein [Paucibacter sp. DJ2R-2]